MSQKINIAVIGCGDFVQRWESSNIKPSKLVEVKKLFDLDLEQAKKLQAKIGGEVVDSDDKIFSDPDIDTVCLFIPPWVRKNLIKKAVDAGKNIITTKPLAPSIEDCEEILKIVDNKVLCGVFYGRTGNGDLLALKKVFESGEIGQLALYRQDWIHHYPSWNDWALDPEKNGGPFMDAMIHNMNLSKYLMGRKVINASFTSRKLAHPDFKCGDTEFMNLDFESNGMANLFITWAADLEVFDTSGNDREHIDLMYMVTDQAWYVTFEEIDGKMKIVAKKESDKKVFDIEAVDMTAYDAFATSVMNKTPLRSDIVSLEDAFEDIKLLKQ